MALLFSEREDAKLISRANSLLRWNALNNFCGKCGLKMPKQITGLYKEYFLAKFIFLKIKFIFV